MDTQNINLNQSDSEESKASKSGKAKKIAGKAAGIAGAAGLGAAATVSAEAMTAGEEVEETLSEATPVVEENAEDVIVEPEVFDPNDIKLDEVSEVELHEETVSTNSTQNVSVDDVVAEVLAPEPITMENSNPAGDVAMIDVDSIESGDCGLPDITPEENWDVDGYNPTNDNDDVLLADTQDAGEPDVLDDILNA